MEIEKVYNIALDIKTRLKFEFMEFVRGDTLNKISFTITNNGQKVKLSDYAFKILLKRPDGQIVQSSPTVVVDKVVYSIGTTELEKCGLVIGAVEIYEGLDKITTKNFTYRVVNSFNAENMLDSETEYPINEITNYTHTQVVPAKIWTVHHTLNKKCSVIVVDSADNTVMGDITYIDMQTIEIRFQAEFSGKAYLN